MKCFKKLLSITTAAAIMLGGLLGSVAIPVNAATPTTFYLRYDIDDHEWRVHVGELLEGDNGKELYYLNNGSEKVNDGDIVVVVTDSENTEKSIGHSDIHIDAHLSNLTINRAGVVLSTGGVDNCYVLGESYAAITGNVTNAYVYDDAKCTFHSNVTNLNLISSQANDVDVDVSVKGTVSYVSVSNPGGLVHEYFNFVADSFYYDHASGLMTDDDKYSKTGSAPAAAATASATTGTASQSNTSSSSSSGEYDDVPKTGEGNLALWLLALSLISFAGCIAFRRSAAKEA